MTRRPRVLHLAYEDPAAPHSGGGSIRTREINERISADFHIDQVFAPFPGAVARQDGTLTYDHLGVARGGRFAQQLGYFAKLPRFVRRNAHRYDLIVEDFGAPFGSIGVPLMSATPTIAVVQWLFAAEKSAQYHLPFRAIETFGVRSHHRFIAVSEGIAEQIRERNAGARVDVVANGLPDDVLNQSGPALSPESRRDILFLGRLDIAHKGLDLLLESYARIAPDVEQDLVIAGEGDGESWLRSEIERRGLSGRVRLIGKTPMQDRFDVLQRADVVAMPSRYESFGMVAAEAAAMGTPVLAYDVACLRDLIPVELRVPAFDTTVYSARLAELCSDRQFRKDAALTLPASVSHLSWDLLAEQQATVYSDSIGGQSCPHSTPAHAS